MLASRHSPWFRRLALLAAALALAVIVFGAFVRLSNAGLSCPDWPTCYGKASWPVHAEDIAAANASFTREVAPDKAWREQLHRHLAATLGLLVLTLALIATRGRARDWQIVLAAAALVGASIPLYMHTEYLAAAVLALAGELLLLYTAWRLRADRRAALAVLTLMVIVIQALLGMWTVTWLLKPIVVMAHLLGGLATLSLLAWLVLRTYGPAARPEESLPTRTWVALGFSLLLVQIALGGWTSANYAAWSCGTDFPTCLGQWWPAADFREGFVLWRGIGVDYEGGVLDATARTAIQLAHRLFAVLASAWLLAIVTHSWRYRSLRVYAGALLILLGAQLAIGIANVKLGLPLWLAVAHNAGAALLLLAVLALWARLAPPLRT
ncbi:MAG: heme A synthase [Lysobacterales bacterium]